MEEKMRQIYPCLWFDNRAEEAVNFYTSIFKNSEILNKTYYGEKGPLPKGTVLTVTFRLNGQEFMALNGGPVFHFTEAISFVVDCDTQEEIDELWEKLSDGGEKIECGWLKDKYGLSWQIVPGILGEIMSKADPEKANKVMKEVLKMKKMDLNKIRKAFEED
jgi:predicted 3-demethylubiquinone-9 3-methyltransferase (glyoxalase superfamily)